MKLDGICKVTGLKLIVKQKEQIREALLHVRNFGLVDLALTRVLEIRWGAVDATERQQQGIQATY